MMEPNMRFEELARRAFDNCKKYGDPFKYAAQERYVNFLPTPSLLGKRILSTILIKLIISSKEESMMTQFIDIEDRIWRSKSQKDVIKIIDDTIELLDLKTK